MQSHWNYITYVNKDGGAQQNALTAVYFEKKKNKKKKNWPDNVFHSVTESFDTGNVEKLPAKDLRSERYGQTKLFVFKQSGRFQSNFNAI